MFKKLVALLIVCGMLGLTTGCPPDPTRDKTRSKGGKEATGKFKKKADRTKDTEARDLDAGDGEKKEKDQK